MVDKVLLVEDDPIAVMLCTKVIEKSGFARKIETAHDGQKAIDYFKQLVASSTKEELENYPRLILLDLNMPILGGWEFLEEFMRTFYRYCPKTKVVILSSSIVPEDREKAERFSIVVDFLSKPISIRDVNNLIEEME